MNNWHRRAAAVAAVIAALTGLGSAPASAWQGCEGRDARCRTAVVAAGDESLPPFAQPLAALGGRTLAEYLAEFRFLDFRLNR